MKRASPSPERSPKRPHLTGGPGYQAMATATWIACGQCATAFGLVPTAIKSFEEAVKHDATDLAALCGLAHSLRLHDISVNETVGSQRAIERLQSALERSPPLLKEAKLFKELAECYLLIGLNENAHSAIQTAIQLDDKDASLWLLSAQTLIRVGARAPAGTALNHCLSLLPQHMRDFSDAEIETARAAHAELAAIAAADGNIELSIAQLTSTLALPAPPLVRLDEHIALWCALCTAKERANDIAGAIAACEQAQQAVGNSSRILINHAYLLLLEGSVDTARAEKAVSLLSNVVDLDKEREELKAASANGPAAAQSAQDFLPWYLLGRAYSVLDKPRLAYDCYQVALRSASNSPITWLAVGKLYLELKQLPDALAAYSQALRLQMEEGSPGTATAWDGLSCVYERCVDQLGDAADACQRSAACFKAMGDLKSAKFFEERVGQLQAASSKQGPVPELRDPPNVPEFLLRDLVALLPSERIAFIQGGDASAAAAPTANGSAQQPTPQPAQVPQALPAPSSGLPGQPPFTAPQQLPQPSGSGAPSSSGPQPASWSPQQGTPQQHTPQQSPPPSLHHLHPQQPPQQFGPQPPPPHLQHPGVHPGHPGQPVPGQFYFPQGPNQPYAPPPPNGAAGYPQPYYGNYVPVQYPINNWGR
ncbi:hypothetical protein DICA0_F25950 [Diutina catenulata]